MKYLPYLLVCFLVLSGGFTWFTVYSAYQEKSSAQASPSNTTIEVVKEAKVVLSKTEDKQEGSPFQVSSSGITEEMVQRWNISDKHIGIDHLLTLINEHNKH